jgi:hypothetical protein
MVENNSPAHGDGMRGANRLRAMQKRNRNLTPADKEAARKLRKKWDSAVAKRKEHGVPLTQDRMAERLASMTGRGTQGLVSQYLNGQIALNYRALLAFADEVGFDPEEVRNDLPEQQIAASRPSAGQAGLSSHQPLELAELRVVIGLTAKALAASIHPAGKELLGALENLPKPLRDREFVRYTIDALRSELPSPRRVRGSAAQSRS